MVIDVLFLAYNRLEFTKESFGHLLANTNWDMVRKLVVIDDGSRDGTREWLDANVGRSPIEVELIHLGLTSPVRAMVHYTKNDPAELFAKIDNDACVPQGWLEAMTTVFAQEGGLELLGMEAGMTYYRGRSDFEKWDGRYTAHYCSHIGGVGLMSSECFTSRPEMIASGRFGFTEFQHTFWPRRAWIAPDLAVALLDRLPFEPWLSLSQSYVDNGWQRDWPKWEPHMSWAWEWMTTEKEEAAA